MLADNLADPFAAVSSLSCTDYSKIGREFERRPFYEAWKKANESSQGEGFHVGGLILDVWPSPLPEDITFAKNVAIFNVLAEEHWLHKDQNQVISEMLRRCNQNISRHAWVEKMSHQSFSDLAVYERGKTKLAANGQVWADEVVQWVNAVVSGTKPGPMPQEDNPNDESLVHPCQY